MEIQEELFGILNGTKNFTGEILLDNISLKTNLSEYRRNIDSIPDNEIFSELSINDYLNFYAILRGVHGSQLAIRKEKIYHKHKYIVSPDIKINQLLPDQRIYIRTLASLLKIPKLLILGNFFVKLESNTLQEIIYVINDYISCNGICLLLTCSPVAFYGLTDTIYLNDYYEK